MNQPVLDAIADHPRTDVRLKAIHLLASTGQPDTFDQLRELALKDGISEIVKTALLEAMYRLDQTRLQEDEGVERAFEFNNDSSLAAPSLTADEAETASAEAFVVDRLEEVGETAFEFTRPEEVREGSEDVSDTAFEFTRPEEVREGAFVINETANASSDSSMETIQSEFESHSAVIEEIFEYDPPQEMVTDVNED